VNVRIDSWPFKALTNTLQVAFAVEVPDEEPSCANSQAKFQNFTLEWMQVNFQDTSVYLLFIFIIICFHSYGENNGVQKTVKR